MSEPSACPTGGPAPHRARWRSADRVLLALATVAVLAGVCYGRDIGTRTTQVALFWPVMAALEVTLAVVALRVSRSTGLAAAPRRFWRAMSFAGAAYATGVVAQLPLVVADPTTVEAAVGGPAYSVCVLVGTLRLVWTMLTSPLGLQTRRQRTRFWLDVATVMVSAATFGCYFTYLSSAGTDVTSPVAIMQLTIGPVAFLVGVFAAVKLLLGGQAPFTLLAGWLGITAATLEGVVRVLRPTLAAHDRLSWEMGLQLVIMAMLAASARAQQVRVRRSATVHEPARRRPYSLAPYVAIGVTYLLLVVVLIRSGLDANAWIVVVGAISGTALVVGRQLAAFTDNARLLAELDDKVRELHATLAERDELAAQLQFQAFHDSLTGLANRALLLQRLASAIHRPADATQDVAVLLVDLDNFKPVNDKLGHTAGDLLLTEIGNRLRACVRSTDIVARLGGDEFAVLIEGFSADVLPTVAGRIVDNVQTPFEVAGTAVSVGASVGVAVCRPGDLSPGELLDRADAAMYTAKNAGKGRFQIVRVQAAPTGPGTR